VDTLTQELLDEIFRNFFVFKPNITKHIQPFPATVRQAVLNCRLVQRRWRDSFWLNSAFICMLEGTPFVWQNRRNPRLEAIADTRFANMMIGLSLCGMDLGLLSEDSLLFIGYLVPLLRRFGWLEHFRYYPISPKCLDGTWSRGKILDLDDRSLDNSGNLALVEDNDDVQNQNEWSYNLFINSICEAGLDIDSIDMPLFGNRAAYCALPTFPCILHPMTLKVLCLTIVSVPEDEASYDWIYRCQTLEALQLSFSMCPKNQPPAYLPPDGYYGIMPGWWPSHSDFRLISLKTSRLMSDNQYSFAVEDICQYLSMFPNISELAFAHIMLAEGTWKDFLERLHSLNLDKLF
jgi:hypothetical protein